MSALILGVQPRIKLLIYVRLGVARLSRGLEIWCQKAQQQNLSPSTYVGRPFNLWTKQSSVNTFIAATLQIAQMAGVCWYFSRSRLAVSSTFDIPFHLQSVACESRRRYGRRHVVPEFIGCAAVSGDVVVRRKGGCSVYGLLNESASSANILMAWQIIARPPPAAAAAASSSINQSVSWSANQSIFRYLAAAPNNQAVNDACRTIGRAPPIQ